ncbi:uncharacterized protein LOC123037987 isoform X2 [Drosophila rhopaloa]|nr:uncharacterized protein LOC123037987 isoform X2 [Drosophila rhopaloa]
MQMTQWNQTLEELYEQINNHVSLIINRTKGSSDDSSDGSSDSSSSDGSSSDGSSSDGSNKATEDGDRPLATSAKAAALLISTPTPTDDCSAINLTPAKKLG